MPIYEYKCKNCNEIFESFLTKPAETPQPCPKCGHVHTQKLLSLANYVNSASSAPSPCCDRYSSCHPGSQNLSESCFDSCPHRKNS